MQSTVFPANDNFMELLFWIDALKRASAESVTAIIPYFSYGKGDKKDEPRVSIRARVCADCIEVAGADRVVTMDLHAPQIQGFFHIPVDNLYALPVLCERVRQEVGRTTWWWSRRTRASPSRRASMPSELRCSVVIADKVRRGHDEAAEILEIIGDVEGMTALVVDDFTISGGTLVDVARALTARGAREVYAAVSHGVLSGRAPAKIAQSPIKKLCMTNSVENQPVELPPNVEVVSVAPLFAEAIKRIHNRESISAMFHG